MIPRCTTYLGLTYVIFYIKQNTIYYYVDGCVLLVLLHEEIEIRERLGKLPRFMSVMKERVS